MKKKYSNFLKKFNKIKGRYGCNLFLLILLIMGICSYLTFYDIRSPQLTIVNPTENSYASGEIKVKTVIKTYHPIYSVEVSIDDNPWEKMHKTGGNSYSGTYEYTWDSELHEDGPCNIVVKLLDTRGRKEVCQITVFVENTKQALNNFNDMSDAPLLKGDSFPYYTLDLSDYQIDANDFTVTTEDVEEPFIVSIENTVRDGDNVIVQGELSVNASEIPDIFWFNVTGEAGILSSYEFEPNLLETATIQITENGNDPLNIQLNGAEISGTDSYTFKLKFVQSNNFNGKIRVGTGSTVVLVYETTTNPTIDGEMSSGEWDAAFSVTSDWLTDEPHNNPPTYPIAAYVMKNSTHVFVAFNSSDDVYNALDFVLVYFDRDNDAPDPGPSDPDADDRAFYMYRDGVTFNSGQGVDGTGTPYWIGVSTSWDQEIQEHTDYWYAEFAFPYSTLDINSGSDEIIGIKFLIADNDLLLPGESNGVEFYWPSGGGGGVPQDSGDNPSSYGDAYVDFNAPQISNVNVNPPSATQGTPFTITATVTDFTNVSKVFAHIQNSSLIDVAIVPLTDTDEDNTFTGDWSSTGFDAGTYYVDIVANDTFNQVETYDSGPGMGTSITLTDDDTDPPVITYTPITSVEYDDDLIVTATITDASGIAEARLYYKLNDDTRPFTNYVVMTPTGNPNEYQGIIDEGNYAFGETINYYVWAIDGDTDSPNDQLSITNPETGATTCSVVDNTDPSIDNPASLDQVNYDQDLIITCVVSEPIDASGVDTVLLWYKIGAGGWTSLDLSSGLATITENLFTYANGTISYYIYANDTAGNILYKYNDDQTTISEAIAQADPYTVTIDDSVEPDIEDPSESANPVEYDTNLTITCSITEPADASGVQSALLWYRIGAGGTWASLDISSGSADILETLFAFSDGAIYYYIYAQDNAGNVLYKHNDDQTTILESIARADPYTVTIDDSVEPDIEDPSESSNPVEYDTNLTITCSVTDADPGDGSGIQNALLWYRIGDFGTWASLDISGGSADILETLFAFSDVTIYYYIYAQDNAGNVLYKHNGDQTTILESIARADPYMVLISDSVDPNIGDPLENLDPVPYNENEIITCSITEPVDASGVDTALLWYKIGASGTWFSLDLSSGSATILESEYDYDDGHIFYYIFAEDNAGNELYKYDGELTTTEETIAQANPYNVTITNPGPEISDPIESADPVDHNIDLTITCSVTEPPDGPGIAIAELWYKIGDGGTWTSLDLSTGFATITEDLFNYADAMIYYYIYGEDNDAVFVYKYNGHQTTTDMATARANPYNVTIGDMTDPTGTIDEPQADSWVGGIVILESTPSDEVGGSGVATVSWEYTLDDGATWIVITLNAGLDGDDSWNTTDPIDIKNDTGVKLRLNVTDNAGNELSIILSLAGVDNVLPDIDGSEPEPIPSEITDEMEVTVHIDESAFSDDVGIDWNEGIILRYSTNGGTTWSNLTMSLGGSYNATIPTQASGTTVLYYIAVRDLAGNEVTTSQYSYTVQSSGGGGGGSSDGGGDDGGSSDGGSKTTEKTMLLTLLTEMPSAVTQGTKFTVKFSLTDEFGNGIEGAIVSLTIGNSSITCTDLGDGIYSVTVDTSGISPGDYDVSISANKEGYEDVTTTLTLTINQQLPLMLVGAGGVIAAGAIIGVILVLKNAGLIFSKKLASHYHKTHV